MEIEKIVPKDGPTIDEFKKYIDKYKGQLIVVKYGGCLLYTSPSPRDGLLSRMPSSA